MDVSSIRKDFPTIRNGDAVYLDSACQSLKPDSVIEKMLEYYNEYPACGGRSVHSMATRVSMGVDETREKLAKFFGSKNENDFVFTKNCTEGMNIVARGFGLKKGDTVLTTDVEHNSNHVQWLEMAKDIGIRRRYCRTSRCGEFDIEEFKNVMDRDVKLVSMGHSSNVTGCTVPIKEVTEIAHDYGAAVLVDGAQAAPHMPVDVVDMDVDFYSASIHKMLGPSGVGFLYGKSERLEKLRPLIYGGGIVGLATYDTVKISPAPERFEAGLENYSGIIGASAAIDYLEKVGMRGIADQETYLQTLIQKGLEDIEEITLVGPEDPSKRGGIFSFNIKGLNPHDVAMMLDNMDTILVRSGMHCAHPFFVSRNINGCVRASVYLYNDDEDIDRFVAALKKIVAIFSKRTKIH
ncbi:MAG: aminotransferase class V-fold PLP-dependent enzyme [Candidatus Methanomethylophilaceae archaeon]